MTLLTKQSLTVRAGRYRRARVPGALVLLSNDNGLLQDAELAWDVRGSPLRSFPWQVHARVHVSAGRRLCASK